MGFEDILVFIVFALFVIPALYFGWRMSRNGTRERDERYPCCWCGTMLPLGATYCPNCKRRIPDSSVVFSSRYVKYTFSNRGMRFLIGFFLAFFLECAVVLGIMMLLGIM